jgi:trimeric autotransporter adhesin
LLLACLQQKLKGQVSVNTDDSAPHSKAMPEVKSNDKGLLIPRMMTTEMELIASPGTGLLINNTDDNAFYSFNDTVRSKLSAGP